MGFDEGCVDEEDLRWLDHQGRHHHRHDFETNPIQAVMVCEWHERDYSLGSTTVFLTNVSMSKPLQPFDDDDDPSLMENYCLTGVKRHWDVSHHPQKTERAARVHGLSPC
jgi:hypothetical protein